MKKLNIPLTAVILLWLISGAGSRGAVNEYYKYFRTDSTYVLTWDVSTSSWVPGSIQLYQYDAGKVTSLLTLDFATRAYQAKTDYIYSTDGLVESETNYAFNNGWVLLTRLLYSYDEFGRYSEIRIQKWTNSQWADDRIQMNYVYDEAGRQLEYQSVYYRNNTWTDPTTEYSYYNSDGLLIRREAIYYTGSTDYQVIYTYEAFDLLSEASAQYPSGTGGWLNWWLVDYGYNPCGLKISQVRSNGSGTEWIPTTKTINYTYFKPDLCPEKKVPVCHNGVTISVKKTVVQTRLNHGDCIGACPGDESPLKNDVVLKSYSPFTIYPNPATDKITVARNGNDDRISKVEIMDLNGNILRSANFNNNGELTIFRNGLMSGQYLLRIYGDQTYNMIVVFK